MKRKGAKVTPRKIETRFAVLRSLISVAAAMLLCLVLILLVSEEPMTAFREFLLGPFESLQNISNIFQTAAPLIFTGLAVCIMFSCNQFNMGAEGSFFLGGLAASWVAVKFVLPAGLHPIVALLIGAAAGALVCGIPGWLKVKLGASEIVSSLMLNYVVLYLGVYFLNYHLLDVNAGFPATAKFPDTVRFESFIPKASFHIGILLAFVMVAVTFAFLRRSKYGYAIRMVGQNEKFARYSGIAVGSTICISQLAGGAIAGLGGACEMLGIYSRFQWVALPGYGFDGIIVATLAGNNPALVPITAVFLAYLRTGADIMSRRSDVATEVLSIVQGVIILMVAARLFLKNQMHKQIVKNSDKWTETEVEVSNG